MTGSFFLYSLPGSDKIIGGKATHPCSGLHTGGFYIAPFDYNSNIRDWTIISPNHFGNEALQIAPEDTSGIMVPEFLNNAISTNQIQHADAIQFIQDTLRQLEKETGTRGKIVSARIKLYQKDINPRKCFEKLCYTYPDAFVFLFYTPQTGMWIGASPEQLLEIENGILTTMSLAGTRAANVNNSNNNVANWDSKNIEEQKIVTEYIIESLVREGLKPNSTDAHTHKAGAVEHIRTLIKTPVDHLAKTKLIDLLHSLSPTPALGGYPKGLALSTIKHTEHFSRGYYGGFCGPIYNYDKLSFYVNLRSGNVSENKEILFAGGGITLLSEDALEWEETTRKLSTLQAIIVPNM